MKHLAESEFKDIQGIVVRGYKQLEAACFVLLKITDGDKAKRWLSEIIDEITAGSERPEQKAVNVAWTIHGLEVINLQEEIRDKFSDEFRAGMTTSHKRRLLGDHGQSAPEHWKWGGPDNDPVDLLLMLYARDQRTLHEEYSAKAQHFAECGLEEISSFSSENLSQGKEHFGFKDGIAQPYVAEFDRSGKKPKGVALGEVLLGYRNGYNRFTQRPLLEPRLDPQALLPPDLEGSDLHDLGKNGTYLVFRQLQQDVKLFWSFIKDRSNSDAGGPEAEYKAIRLASKMVGRWPSGVPLVKSPHEDQPGMKQLDDFLYHHADRFGLKCPLGSHIRRTNPRDSLDPEPGTEKSLAFSDRHRILRRGRAYGPPLSPSVDPKDLMANLNAEDAGERGLLFICLNANIGRQFEFVQHTWANNPNFNGLYEDPDPIIGDRATHGKKQDTFTIQNEPVRKRISGMPDFVKVLGGAYFFLPSKRALKFIAS